MTVSGDGQIIRNPSSASLLSSRFIVAAAGPHQTPGLSFTDATYIIWDPTADWNDLGFPSDFSTPGQGGFFFTDVGDYLINTSSELDPDTAYSTGQFQMGIESGLSSSETYATTEIPNGTGNFAQLSISTVLRCTVGGLAQSFKVPVFTWTVDDTCFIAKAVCTITKLTA